MVGRGLQESQGPPGSHTFQRCPTTERSCLCAGRAERGFAPGSALCSFRPRGGGWRSSPWAGETLAPGHVGFPGLGTKPGLASEINSQEQWGTGGRGEVGVEISFSVGPRSLEPGAEGQWRDLLGIGRAR